MAARCRLCTTNDREGLMEQLAIALWDSRRAGDLNERPWEQAGEYWQHVFREFAATALETLRGGA